MSQTNILLGVNIDHVATLRQARGTPCPDPVHAALQIEQAGADSITRQLREDRRHIQDRDVYNLRARMLTRNTDTVYIGLEQSVKRYKQAMLEARA